MIQSKLYGRSIETWLIYRKLPIFFGSRLYFVLLNEAYYSQPGNLLRKLLPCELCNIVTTERRHNDYLF